MTKDEGAARPLSLKVIGPKGGQAATMEVGAGITGKELKGLLPDIAGMEPDCMSLLFQNGSRNSVKLILEDSKTLEEQGVKDEATITVRPAEQHAVARSDSFLRQSIAKNGTSSYYYAHANEKALPAEHRYVYGGEPAKLEELSPEDAAAAQPQAALAQAISSYSWADEGDFVCIYISAEGEVAAVVAAGDGKDGQVNVEFGTKSMELKIRGSPRDFALALRGLENEIVPEECKYRVSTGKRVTLKLKKRRQTTW
eukprot:CAMPEP_0183438794 /NCGR_PEP_ID=MMETSP0370-20130417/77607_1 /TAXON_ID=268820 /ORGANISM="Peridinium aciculiferum, Strain PAER-2" /LENGTH=254 /DNA_ID=CAMNT_0025627093 /DNA_START=17 /DNA_END=778 /DNA_ORIENTATION=-